MSYYKPFKIDLPGSSKSNRVIKCPTAAQIEKHPDSVKYVDGYDRVYYWNRRLYIPEEYLEHKGVEIDSYILLISKASDDHEEEEFANEGSELGLKKVKTKKQTRDESEEDYKSSDHAESVQNLAPENIDIVIDNILDTGISRRKVRCCIAYPLTDKDGELWSLFLDKVK